eukprot:COSAG05_NODE_1892_length_3878_cov_4.195025_1_plen_55_part_00
MGRIILDLRGIIGQALGTSTSSDTGSDAGTGTWYRIFGISLAPLNFQSRIVART